MFSLWVLAAYLWEFLLACLNEQCWQVCGSAATKKCCLSQGSLLLQILFPPEFLHSPTLSFASISHLDPMSYPSARIFTYFLLHNGSPVLMLAMVCVSKDHRHAFTRFSVSLSFTKRIKVHQCFTLMTNLLQHESTTVALWIEVLTFKSKSNAHFGIISFWIYLALPTLARVWIRLVLYHWLYILHDNCK